MWPTGIEALAECEQALATLQCSWPLFLVRNWFAGGMIESQVAEGQEEY